MKSKQSSLKKAFLPYLPQQPSFSSNWGDNIDMAVDTPTSISTTQDNMSSPYVQSGGSNISISHG